MKSVDIYPVDQTACGHYRIIWPGTALKDQGYDVTLHNKSPRTVFDTANPPNIKGIVLPGDVSVFQRAASYQHSQIVGIARDYGKKIVFDIDDSLSCIHPRNAASKGYDPRISQKKNWMHAVDAYNAVDLVTCTTEALAEEYGSHGRVVIIPNHIPERYLSIPRPENDIPVIGWAGYTLSHPDDLIVTGGMINQCLTDTGASFTAFGDLDIFRQLQIRHRPPNKHQNFVEITDYPNQLSKFDIGLVPLKLGPFNSAKSWLKAMEYCSLGVVPVVSPTPDNQKLIDRGVAIPASKPREWYDRVRELVEDENYRMDMSKKCREFASDWTIEGNTFKWWNAWMSAGK